MMSTMSKRDAEEGKREEIEMKLWDRHLWEPGERLPRLPPDKTKGVLHSTPIKPYLSTVGRECFFSCDFYVFDLPSCYVQWQVGNHKVTNNDGPLKMTSMLFTNILSCECVEADMAGRVICEIYRKQPDGTVSLLMARKSYLTLIPKDCYNAIKTRRLFKFQRGEAVVVNHLMIETSLSKSVAGNNNNTEFRVSRNFDFRNCRRILNVRCERPIIMVYITRMGTDFYYYKIYHHSRISDNSVYVQYHRREAFHKPASIRVSWEWDAVLPEQYTVDFLKDAKKMDWTKTLKASSQPCVVIKELRKYDSAVFQVRVVERARHDGYINQELITLSRLSFDIGSFFFNKNIFDEEYEYKHDLRNCGPNGLTKLYQRKSDGKYFVVKEPHPGQPRCYAQFYNAMTILLHLNHPNIISPVAAVDDPDTPKLILPYIRGRDLFSYRCENGPMPEKLVKYITMQLSLTLAYLHVNKIAYVNINPYNIFITSEKDPWLMLIDFGCAIYIPGGCVYNRVVDYNDFIAPESKMGKVSTFSDMWGLGATTYWLLTGKIPFSVKTSPYPYRRGDTNYRVKLKHLENVSENGQDFLKKLLVFNDVKRLTAIMAARHSWIIDDPSDYGTQSRFARALRRCQRALFEGVGCYGQLFRCFSKWCCCTGIRTRAMNNAQRRADLLRSQAAIETVINGRVAPLTNRAAYFKYVASPEEDNLLQSIKINDRSEQSKKERINKQLVQQSINKEKETEIDKGIERDDASCSDTPKSFVTYNVTLSSASSNTMFQMQSAANSPTRPRRPFELGLFRCFSTPNLLDDEDVYVMQNNMNMASRLHRSLSSNILINSFNTVSMCCRDAMARCPSNLSEDTSGSAEEETLMSEVEMHPSDCATKDLQCYSELTDNEDPTEKINEPAAERRKKMHDRRLAQRRMYEEQAAKVSSSESSDEDIPKVNYSP